MAEGYKVMYTDEILRQREKPDYQCCLCNVSFTNVYNLKYHKQTKHEGKRYISVINANILQSWKEISRRTKNQSMTVADIPVSNVDLQQVLQGV